MSSVVILDTSVFCDIVEVPGRSQRKETTLRRLATLIEKGSTLLLPLAAVYETGNHIAQVKDGGSRRRAAERFVTQVRGALAGDAPWTPTPFPDTDTMHQWLDEFPDRAMEGVGIADLSMIRVFETQCHLNRTRRVWIWSHDSHLSSYDRRP